ncbi:hypothetical protein SAMN06265222_1393 [Neorhodopirellula lusitana]|uniref:Uncharacterized protein n=1 Tax=Neorhodopirellula lusitana TaxID=445327 RepID=A0ABY1QWP2_9BACT|nr:hypothetical protein SAMN06265222_1393 [Neorhodopirellula lusitana]
MTRQRYLIDAYGPDEHAMGLALRTCEFLANDCGNAFAMVVDCIFSTSENESLLKLLGRDAFDSLIANGTAIFNEIQVSIYEADTFPNTIKTPVVLLPFCHNATLLKIEAREHVSTIVAFPWREGDTEEWERTYNPRLVKRDFPVSKLLP